MVAEEEMVVVFGGSAVRYEDKTKAYSLPLKPKKLYVKSLVVEDLSEASKAPFLEAFAKFFAEPPPDLRVSAREAEGIRSEPRYNMRRFSGGASLPNGRYYTLCYNAEGASNQTLAMELLAYATASPDRSYDVFDLNNDCQFIKERLSNEQRAFCEKYDDRVIVLENRPIGFDARAVIQREIKPEALITYHILPYRVQQIERDSVLDLREKDAMSGLLRLLWEQAPRAYMGRPSGRPFRRSLKGPAVRGQARFSSRSSMKRCMRQWKQRES